MRYLVLLGLLVGCSKDPKTFVNKCFKPFIYSGEIVKVLECSDKGLMGNGSNFCVIERKRQTIFGNEYREQTTMFVSNLEDYAIEVNCSEY